jgi:hypothetical protein
MREVVHEKVSDQLEGWLGGDGPKSIGSLIELFGERSFAIVFVLLMAIPALPLPTAGATHVLEVITMLLALELIVGRRTIWLPARARRRRLAGTSSEKFTGVLLRRIRWFERYSRPRLGRVFSHRLAGSAFGLLVLALSVVAFVAPPFSGLDTLPSLGVVVLSLGVLMTDLVMAGVGVAIGAVGTVLVIGLGSIVVNWLHSL